jgi:Uma2 family endonuclease
VLSPAVQTRLWTRQEYERLVAEGFFHPEERLELVDGEIIRMTPQGSPHATASSLAADTLRTCFGPSHLVRVQMPLALGPDSEPEPDIAVVVGNARDYRDAHPQTAVLIVEVSDTTLTYDRERKARLYARATIPEYWIVNLLERRLEVYRDSISTGAGGPAYRTRVILDPSKTIAPLAAPSSSIAVADLLP